MKFPKPIVVTKPIEIKGGLNLNPGDEVVGLRVEYGKDPKKRLVAVGINNGDELLLDVGSFDDLRHLQS